MTYDQILEHFGGDGRDRLIRAAKALKMKKSTVASWRLRGVPRGRQFEIQARTGGVLLADKARARA